MKKYCANSSGPIIELCGTPTVNHCFSEWLLPTYLLTVIITSIVSIVGVHLSVSNTNNPYKSY